MLADHDAVNKLLHSFMSNKPEELDVFVASHRHDGVIFLDAHTYACAHV